MTTKRKSRKTSDHERHFSTQFKKFIEAEHPRETTSGRFTHKDQKKTRSKQESGVTQFLSHPDDEFSFNPRTGNRRSAAKGDFELASSTSKAKPTAVDDDIFELSGLTPRETARPKPKPKEPKPKPAATRTASDRDRQLDELSSQRQAADTEYQRLNKEATRLRKSNAPDEDQSRINARIVAAHEARKQIEGRYNRIVEYDDLVKANPRLIAPGPIEERLAQDTGSAAIIDRMAGMGRDLRQKQDRHREVLTELRTVEESRRNATTPLKGKERTRIEKLRAEELKLDQEIGRAKRTARDEVTTLLKADDPTPIPLNPGSFSTFSGELVKPSRDLQGRIDDGAGWLSNVMHRAGSSPLKPLDTGAHPVDSPDQRAAYSGGFMRLSEHSDVKTVIHELGHHIEQKVNEGSETVQARAVEFLNYRVGSEPPRPMSELEPSSSQFRSWEKGRKDKFEDAFGDGAGYVGKDYGGDGTEIVSMGLQKLHEDPLHFAASDPEYARFIVGILRGSLR